MPSPAVKPVPSYEPPFLSSLSDWSSSTVGFNGGVDSVLENTVIASSVRPLAQEARVGTMVCSNLELHPRAAMRVILLGRSS